METQIDKALSLISRFGGTDGAHHKQWVLDQVVRLLTACPQVELSAIDCNGKPYSYTALGMSKEYIQWKAEHEEGGKYEWDVGVPP